MSYFLLTLPIFLVIAFFSHNRVDKDNLKSFLKKHKKEMVLVFCLTLLILFTYLINRKIEYLFTAFCVGLFPAYIPFMLYEIYESVQKQKEQKNITGLLMILTKWSAVKNDAVYCLQKATKSQLASPIAGYVYDICLRLESGMGVSETLKMSEERVLSEELRYVFQNIRYAYEKGGSLYSIFKNLEGQFFKIDEETYKRKISTANDIYSLYSSVALVVASFIIIVINNPYSKNYYLNSERGIFILGLFSLLFFLGVIIMGRIIKR